MTTIQDMLEDEKSRDLDTIAVPVNESAEPDQHFVVVEEDLAAARSRFTYEDANRLKRKADFRVLPLLMVAYLIKNIDQSSTSVSYLPKRLFKGSLESCSIWYQ
jgi:hypothetical protein